MRKTAIVGFSWPVAFALAIAIAAPVAFARDDADTITVGSLVLTKCVKRYVGYCGSIEVPLDRHGDTPGTLTVGFEFYPHTETMKPSAGVILAQEGGPGYSSTGSRDGYVRLFAPLRTTRDILLIDKRGTGRSSAIDCPDLQRAYQPSQADIAACANQLGQDAWFHRSADAADDVADVMAALRFRQADFYGDSYGTWFGQVLAVTHPKLLRTIVLDSAYPVLGDHPNSEVNHGQEAMDIVCRRSMPCRRLGSSATTRFAALLDALRANPITGMAPGANGRQREVTADPAGLFLVIAAAGDAPTTWRDLDAAGRAWMDDRDSLPLLRLVAESRDAYSGGGSYKEYSAGLAAAVACAEYPTNFDLGASLAVRTKQYRNYLAWLRANRPHAFAPFAIEDAIDSQMDVEQYDACLTWPKPAASVPVARPIPPGSVFPNIPVLVLSGELDTVTSPSEGKATADLFPDATYIVTNNLVHESAISDGGFYVSPNGQDLSQCIGPIVRHFIETGGNTGSIDCVQDIRPIRTVPAFATTFAATMPARARAGNATGPVGLELASAATETVGDAIARYYVNAYGSGAGLRGGTFAFSATATGYAFVLDDAKWTNDLPVSGTIDWNQLTGDIVAKVTLGAASGHTGAITIRWNDRQTEAIASLSGSIDGARLSATRIAP